MENLKKVKETILELIYPSKCPFCGEIVSAGKKHSTEHNGICKACREKLPYIGAVRCMCCGKPLTDPAEEYCYDCTRQKHLFVDGRSLWVHKDAVGKCSLCNEISEPEDLRTNVRKRNGRAFSFLSMGKKDHLDRAGSAAFPAKKKAGI